MNDETQVPESTNQEAFIIPKRNGVVVVREGKPSLVPAPPVKPPTLPPLAEMPEPTEKEKDTQQRRIEARRAAKLFEQHSGLKNISPEFLFDLKELGVYIEKTRVGNAKSTVGLFISQERLERVITDLYGIYDNTKAKPRKLKIADMIRRCEHQLNMVRQQQFDRQPAEGSAPPAPPQRVPSFPPSVAIQINGENVRVQATDQKPLAKEPAAA